MPRRVSRVLSLAFEPISSSTVQAEKSLENWIERDIASTYINEVKDSCGKQRVGQTLLKLIKLLVSIGIISYEHRWHHQALSTLVYIEPIHNHRKIDISTVK
jgi:hypothetical protein